MNPPLYESEGVLAVDKPAGTAVIPGRDGPRGDSLHERLMAARGEKLWVVHRLDRDTSGVLVFARNAPAHRALSMAFEAGRVEKTYLALVEGLLDKSQEVDVPLVPARRGRMRPAREGEEGKPAQTRVRPLEHFSGQVKATLVEASPLTGRTHQIRVHLRSLGHPLVVDHQYGSAEPFPKEAPVLLRTPLHAASLGWRGIEGVEDAALTSPLPDDLARALAWLRGA